jgi:hypothetical protein
MLKPEYRKKFPPGGYRFFQPQTGWPPDPTTEFSGMTLEQTEDKVIEHRKDNPRFKLPIDRKTVEEDVCMYTAATLPKPSHPFDPEFCLTDRASKKEAGLPPSRSLPAAGPRAAAQPVAGGAGSAIGIWARNTIAGIGTYLKWFGSRVTVPHSVSGVRAMTCLVCPKHSTHPGALDRMNQIIGSELMRVMNILTLRKLATSVDDRLGVCLACDCPVKVKVHCDLKHILENITPEAKAALDPACWILSEEKTT